MARKAKDITSTEIVNVEEIVNPVEEIETVESELLETEQDAVNSEIVNMDDDDDDDDNSDDDDGEDGDESNVVLMQRAEAKKIVNAIATARKTVSAAIANIDSILADTREFLPAEKFAEIRNKHLKMQGLTGDVEIDAIVTSGFTTDQIALADITLRDPVEDFLTELDAINADPNVRNAFAILESAYDKASVLVGRHGLRSRIGRINLYVDTRTGMRKADEFASKLDARVTGGTKSGSGRSRKPTVRGGNVLPGLDIVGKSDGYTFHLVSQGGNGRTKDGWRLEVLDGNMIVKDYESSTLALAKDVRGNNPTINYVVNVAIQQLTGNPKVKRSAPQVFSGHRIYDTQSVAVTA